MQAAAEEEKRWAQESCDGGCLGQAFVACRDMMESLALIQYLSFQYDLEESYPLLYLIVLLCLRPLTAYRLNALWTKWRCRRFRFREPRHTVFAQLIVHLARASMM